jgi:hypothetical protein
MSESHALSSTLSVIPTHAFWKRPARLTTQIFVDLDMDNTTYDHGPNSNGDDIQRAERLELEVVQSQAHHNGYLHNLESRND